MKILFILDDGTEVPVMSIKTVQVTENHRIMVQVPSSTVVTQENSKALTIMKNLMDKFFAPAKCQLFIGEMAIKAVQIKKPIKRGK